MQDKYEIHYVKHGQKKVVVTNRSGMTWLEAWTPIEHLPAKLALTLEDERSEWPELVLPLRDLALSRGGTGGFVSGGGRR